MKRLIIVTIMGFLQSVSCLFAQPYPEQTFWKGYWIWAAPAQVPPALHVNLGEWLKMKPGGWGGVLPARILAEAASSGFDSILWDLCDAKGRLLYPSKQCNSDVLRWPNWGVDFAQYNYPQQAASLAKELKLNIKFVVDEIYFTDARDSLPDLDVISTIQANEIPIVLLSKVNFSEQNHTNMVHEPVCFRKSFCISGPIHEGRITVTAEEKYALYVNGTWVASGAGWKRSNGVEDIRAFMLPETYNLRPYLVNGENVLAFRVMPDSDKTGLLVNMEWTDEAGRHELATDPTWKYSTSATNGWMKVSFKDVKWQNAHVVGLDRLGGRRWRMKNPWVNSLPTSKDRPWLARIVKGVTFESTGTSQTADLPMLGDGNLSDSSSFRVGPFPETITITLPKHKRINSVRLYSGYLDNYDQASTELSLKDFSLEYWDGTAWCSVLPSVKYASPYDGKGNQLFSFLLEFKPIQTNRLRVIITDSSDKGLRVTGKIPEEQRGCYLREIEVIKENDK